jgi:hypothetical protein
LPSCSANSPPQIVILSEVVRVLRELRSRRTCGCFSCLSSPKGTCFCRAVVVASLKSHPNSSSRPKQRTASFASAKSAVH